MGLQSPILSETEFLSSIHGWKVYLMYQCHSFRWWPKKQKCCNQMCSARVQWSKMWLQLGLRPGPSCGAFNAPPNSVAGFKNTAKNRKEGGKGRRNMSTPKSTTNQSEWSLDFNNISHKWPLHDQKLARPRHQRRHRLNDNFLPDTCKLLIQDYGC